MSNTTTLDTPVRRAAQAAMVDLTGIANMLSDDLRFDLDDPKVVGTIRAHVLAVIGNVATVVDETGGQTG